MKYLIDIPAQQTERIQKHLSKGSFQSFSQFVSVAIENQLALEENGLEEFLAFKMETPAMPLGDTKKNDLIERYKFVNIRKTNPVLEAPNYKKLVFSSQKIGESYTWIWGQINKIFPVKLGVRILHQKLEGRSVIDLNDFLDTVAKEATSYAKHIRDYEETNSKMRDEKISAGLPSKDEKSQTRYKYQFMAYQRKDGLLDGAMAILKFCNIINEEKNGKLMIGLTEAGLKFSMINNPILDQSNYEKSLTHQEVLFYLAHIKDNLKGEFEATKWMLDKINKGVKQRELLNVEVRKSYGEIWKATETVINTQRAGLTARMFELGLINKEKNGIYVTYGISELGKEYLTNK